MPKNRIFGVTTAVSGGSSSYRKVPPKGHFAVYVGPDDKTAKRFVVPMCVLKNEVFQKLLDKAAEEYGFDSGRSSKLVIPCDELAFRRLIASIGACEHASTCSH
ncbi:hypothetical protein DM860_013680 [Cuscuta australis]|uniref:Auxin-responsive protein n=1 Tax=Cuscuta australis TaxID=267555 RepID=A0A328EAI1_9ASTE|nr:hypothetical protein DM860_013680 [Cuscuta australis]